LEDAVSASHPSYRSGSQTASYLTSHQPAFSKTQKQKHKQTESKHLQPEEGANMFVIKVYKLLGQSSSRAICFGPILVPLGLVHYNLAVPSPPGSAPPTR
jgi:hypothetical protein